MVFTLEDINNLLAACGVCAEEVLSKRLKEKDYGFKSDPNGRFAPASCWILPYVYRVVDGKTEYVLFNGKNTKALMTIREVKPGIYDIFYPKYEDEDESEDCNEEQRSMEEVKEIIRGYRD